MNRSHVAWLTLTVALAGCGSSGAGSRANGGAPGNGGAAGATASGGATVGGSTASGGTAQGGASNTGGTAGSVATGGHAGQYVIVPPPPGSDIQVEIQYHSGVAATSEDIQPEIHLQNKILTSVLLNEIEIRYYLTLDGEQVNALTWSPSGSIPNPVKCCFVGLTANMVVELVALPTPVTGADHYLKITFTTDNSIFLRYTDVAELRLATYTNDPLVQSNDYSFNPSSTFIAWDHITVYRNGNLVWGVEPI